ncbi:MAG: gamma-glutamylcyclotransferase family protein [Bacteroidia bacterium]
MPKDKAKSDLIFVYGTLLRDTENPMSQYLESKSDYIGMGYMPGTLYKVTFYPGATFDPNSKSKVWGEVSRLHDPEQVFQVLDTYEDFNPKKPNKSLFIRDIVPVNIDGEVFYCSSYIYNHTTDGLEVLDSGYFLKG